MPTVLVFICKLNLPVQISFLNHIAQIARILVVAQGAGSVTNTFLLSFSLISCPLANSGAIQPRGKKLTLLQFLWVPSATKTQWQHQSQVIPGSRKQALLSAEHCPHPAEHDPQHRPTVEFTLILPKPPAHENVGKADCCSLGGFPVNANSQTRREATYHTGL